MSREREEHEAEREEEDRIARLIDLVSVLDEEKAKRALAFLTELEEER